MKKLNILMLFAILFQLSYPVAVNAQEIIEVNSNGTSNVRNTAANIEFQVEDQDGNPLEGVKYNIYKTDGTLMTPTALQSDINGKISTVRGPGDYYIVQAEDYSNSNGDYFTDTTKYPFTVSTADDGVNINVGTSIVKLDTNPQYHVNKTVTSSSPGGLVPGATLTYRITMVNDGYVIEENNKPIMIPLHDSLLENLPSWLTLQSEDWYAGNHRGSLANGDAMVMSAGGIDVEYTLKVGSSIPSDVKTLDNIASLSDEALSACNDQGNTCDSASISTVASVPLAISKTVKDADGNGGINHMEDASYTITISNPDQYATYTDIPVHDSLVENQLSWYKFANDVKVSGTSVSGNLGDGTLTIDKLAPGQTATITYTMSAGTIPPLGQAPSNLVNVVTVDGSQKNTCPEGTVDCAEAQLAINHVVPTNTKVYKSVSDSNNNDIAQVGETLDYTIRLVNETNEPLLSSIEFTDSLLENMPAYLTYNNDFIATASKGNDAYTGDVTKGNLVFNPIDANETITITYSLTLNSLPEDATITDITNVARTVTEESTDGKSAEATIPLATAKANASLTKVDDQGNPLAGVKFKISNNDIASGVPVQELSTDADGKITFVDLPVGEYTVKETKPLAGYKINKNEFPIVIKVSDNGKTILVNNGKPIVNEKMEGDYDVTKSVVSSDPNGLVSGAILDYTVDIDAYTEGVVSNVPIHDSLLENLPSWLTLVPDSNYINQSNVSGDITNGTATIDKIGPGVPTQYVYQLKVGDVPADVKAVDNIFTIGEDLPSGDACLANDSQCSMATVKRLDGTISLHKVDQDGNELAGAKFTVTDSKGNIVDTITTDADGNAKSKVLLGGDYEVSELEAPTNYILDNTVYPVSIKEAQSDVKVNDGKDIVNQIKQGSISLHKVDQDGKDLAGAEFTVTDNKGNVVDTITSDSKGNATSKLLPVGDYKVVETKAPNNYLLDSTVYPVSIKNNNDITKVNNGKDIVNQIKQGSISLHKVDQDGKSLAGAEFSVTDNKGNVVDTITSDSKGNATSKLLAVGDYKVMETKAPSDYVLDNTTYNLSITKDQEVVKVNKGRDIVNQIKQGTITLHKVDQDGNDLAGAEFTIFDENNKVVGTLKSGQDGMATSKKLPVGNYLVKETKAPKGYMVTTSSFKATITSNMEDVKLNGGKGIVNNAIKIPETPEEPTVPVSPEEPTDPQVKPTDPNKDLVDTDKDGITDQDETEYGTDPSLADTDKDGIDDLKEMNNRTNPLVNNQVISNTGLEFKLVLVGELIIVLFSLLLYRRQM